MAQSAAQAEGRGAPQKVKLPSGWAGLSFEVARSGRRAVITEVPRACFSSKAFAAEAGGQVEGVAAGDVIVAINGDEPRRLAERILTDGDALCVCSGANGRQKHRVASLDKYATPPCASCDFARRREKLGLSVALQMWLKTIKAEREVYLTVWKKGCAPPDEGGDAEAEPVQAGAGIVVIGNSAKARRGLPDNLDQPLGKKGRVVASVAVDAQRAVDAAASARRRLDQLRRAHEANDAAGRSAAYGAARQASFAAQSALAVAAAQMQGHARMQVQMQPFGYGSFGQDMFQQVPVETRLDATGRAYTLLEFVQLYGGSPQNPPPEWFVERRLDSDGRGYTLQEFILQYGGSLHQPPIQWTGGVQLNEL